MNHFNVRDIEFLSERQRPTEKERCQENIDVIVVVVANVHFF